MTFSIPASVFALCVDIVVVSPWCQSPQCFTVPVVISPYGKGVIHLRKGLVNRDGPFGRIRDGEREPESYCT